MSDDPYVPLRCRLFGHRWSHRLEDVGKDDLFFRIDCTREGCEYAMDATRLRDLGFSPETRRAMRLP